MLFTIFTMFFAGLILFLIGVADGLTNNTPQSSRDLSFMIIGSILLIPGMFYSYRIIHVI